MPWRDLRYPKRRRLLISLVVVVLVMLAFLAVVLNYAAVTPTCSLEAPQLWHRLTGCRIVKVYL